jgi:dTDP-4-amino-4,6-dideoxygalactose transaminase
VKLRHLENWTEARRARAAHYDRVLSAANVSIPSASAGLRHVYHIYAIRVADRAATQAALAAEGIQTGIHYPFPVHLLPAYADLGYRAGDFPHSERAANEVLSLPMYPELTAAQQDVVADALKALSPSVAA